MKVYLKGEIDNKIYNDLLKHLNSKEKFFETRAWLKEELQNYAVKNNKKYIPANTIIRVAKENEAILTKSNIQEYEDKNLLLANNEIKEDSKEE